MQDNKSDKKISIWGESTARLMERRNFLTKSTKGVFAIVAGATIGSFAGVKQAFANTCPGCDWAFSGRCYGGANSSCPSGCSTCTTSDWCNGWCDYSSGTWISCSGLGRCGYGYTLCRDCKCPNCTKVCTTLSGVICSGCCTAQQVVEETKRLSLEHAALPTH